MRSPTGTRAAVIVSASVRGAALRSLFSYSGSCSKLMVRAGDRKEICPGPDSNRHGVSPEGFSYPLQLSLLHARRVHLGSGLYLCHAAKLQAPGDPGAAV